MVYERYIIRYIPSRNMKGVVKTFLMMHIHTYVCITDIPHGKLSMTKLYIQGILKATAW
jgi:hypothetical protein